MSPSLSHAAPAQVRPEPIWKAILESAAMEVFEIMAGARLEPIQLTTEEPQGDRTAMVGMAGAVCGMTILRCNGPIAQMLATRMADAEAAKNPATVGDALGELCNMIAGNFKSKISSLNDRCMLSVPTFISGEDYLLQPATSSEGFDVALRYEEGEIWISLVVHT